MVLLARRILERGAHVEKRLLSYSCWEVLAGIITPTGVEFRSSFFFFAWHSCMSRSLLLLSMLITIDFFIVKYTTPSSLFIYIHLRSEHRREGKKEKFKCENVLGMSGTSRLSLKRTCELMLCKL